MSTRLPKCVRVAADRPLIASVHQPFALVPRGLTCLFVSCAKRVADDRDRVKVALFSLARAVMAVGSSPQRAAPDGDAPRPSALAALAERTADSAHLLAGSVGDETDAVSLPSLPRQI